MEIFMIKCCIFDLDGTVLDTLTTIAHFVNSTLSRYGIENITEDECRRFVGNGARALITRAVNSKSIYDDKLIDAVLSDYNLAYDAEPLYLTSVFDGIERLLAELKERKIKLALISNKPDSTVQSLAKAFFGDTFDAVAGGTDGVPLKPDPASARRILGGFGIKASETAWIGDTATDVKTGKNLGVRLNIGVLWGFRTREELEGVGADKLVSSADEIFGEVTAVD